MDSLIRSQYILIILLSTFMTACGGGSSGGSSGGSNEQPSEVLTGVLVDSAVSGVSFSTDTQSGQTNTQGEYQYRVGEDITFRVGNIVLGSAKAAQTLTPVDLAGEEATLNQTAINLLVFLQSLDEDSDPANGIEISDAVFDRAAGLDLDFSSASFGSDAQSIFLQLTDGSKTMVSEQNALIHFYQTYKRQGGKRDLGFDFEDTDGDDIPNRADSDDDNDGVIDGDDAFPLDNSESLDTDRDGIGNNADTDDDNDNVLDQSDAFPLDSSESVDTDGDGIGNNADTDDDNDGTPDSEDLSPLTPPPNEAPVAHAGINQDVIASSNVSLDGDESTDDKAIVSYRWQQLQGTSVTLTDSMSAVTEFVALSPLEQTETLIFELTVEDEEGLSSTDTVEITVYKQPNSPLLSGSAYYSQVTLNWEPVAHAESYSVYYAEQSFGSPPDLTNYNALTGATLINGITDNSYSTASLTHGQEYFFVVTATIGLAESNPSSEVKMTPLTRRTVLSQPLNDTGISVGGKTAVSFPFGNNDDCTGIWVDQQDCARGRDAQARAGVLRKQGSGVFGFDFTRVNADGSDHTLGSDYANFPWACVRDNHTGLLWEVKTTGDSAEARENIHHADHLYRWGGVTASGTHGYHSNDWDSLVNGSNQESLCDCQQWRVPLIKELYSLFSYQSTGTNREAIDKDFFPNTPDFDPDYDPRARHRPMSFWTAAPANNRFTEREDAVSVTFIDSAGVGFWERSRSLSVRLVCSQ